jgi:hypothetical protein
MSATNPSTTPAPASVNLDTGKDLTSLDDASLLSELGYDPAPEGAADASEQTSAQLEDEVIKSVVPVGEGASEDEPESPPAVEPEPEVAPPAAAAPNAAPPEKQLAAQFTVFDNEAELEIPSDFFVSFKADSGKEFEKVPLDKVVRLAQQGVYNHRLQTEVQEARETQNRLSAMQAELSEKDAAHQRTIALAERLLQDPEFFDQALAEYEAYNAPDAQLARLKAENEALKSQAQAPAKPASDATDAQQFFDTKAVPVFQSIITQFPAVSAEELLGRFMLLTGPLQVNGKVPKTRFADVERILVNEITPWAQSLHEERAAVVAERTKAAKAAEKAKVAAATSKRQLSRVIKPAGRAAPDVATRKPAGNADDEANNLLADIFAS